MNTNKKIIIGTHDGIFHQDEVVAIALLSLFIGSDFEIIRTRNSQLLASCDYVVDVGGGEFDHHMPGGNGTRIDGVPYASAGLVWKKYATNILSNFTCPNELIECITNRIDTNIIEPVDKIDNGIYATSLFNFIPLYIPNWNDDFNKVDAQFNQALSIAINILHTAISKEISNAISDNLMCELIFERTKYSPILEIPNQYIDWKPQVIEANQLPSISIYFVVFPYPSGGYAAQAVPPSISEPFKQRISFPTEWAGLTTTLPVVSGVETATFCHNNLFFVRAKTKEDVIKLCKIAIEKC